MLRSAPPGQHYAAARESLERLKSFGINFVYTHNYGCEPGSHLSFTEILRAADDVGMLVALSQPHFSHYEWKQRRRRREQRLRAARGVLRSRGGQPSIRGRLLDEPQRHRLRRRHEPRPDRRHSRPARPVVAEQRADCACGPKRSSSASIPAASCITMPPETSA